MGSARRLNAYFKHIPTGVHNLLVGLLGLGVLVFVIFFWRDVGWQGLIPAFFLALFLYFIVGALLDDKYDQDQKIINSFGRCKDG